MVPGGSAETRTKSKEKPGAPCFGERKTRFTRFDLLKGISYLEPGPRFSCREPGFPFDPLPWPSRQQTEGTASDVQVQSPAGSLTRCFINLNVMEET
jgi:hypothetical protein